MVVFFPVYLFILKESMSRGRAEREEERRIPSGLHTISAEPDVGLELMSPEIMTWAKIKSWTLNQLSHPGAPTVVVFSWLLYACQNFSNYAH